MSDKKTDFIFSQAIKTVKDLCLLYLAPFTIWQKKQSQTDFIPVDLSAYYCSVDSSFQRRLVIPVQLRHSGFHYSGVGRNPESNSSKLKAL